MFIYISHRDPVDALLAARSLMEQGMYPFVPQLNKLIPGRKDEAWENYFKMWLFRCDVLWCTASFRPHEVRWAQENKIPTACNMKELSGIKLNPFGELGRRFGEACSLRLTVEENWRKCDAQDQIKIFENIVGLGSDPLTIGTLALTAWDRKVNG